MEQLIIKHHQNDFTYVNHWQATTEIWNRILILLKQWKKIQVRYFRNDWNEKGTGAEMCPAIVFGIVTGDARE